MTEQLLVQEDRKPEIDKLGRSYATGRRKKSSARVWIQKGNGKITINGKDAEIYFGRPVLRMVIGQVFDTTNTNGEIDVVCSVKGGGLSGQAGAILHGIARALDKYNPEFHSVLRKGGFLTRDSRAVERKKPGRPKARKSFQFSKR
ncbi:MAG: 30S ribosomal protein S9 [Rickettsiales bacterium]|nr:30S ribosomal protein S9 [Pseudomonadota bacterium]MDA0966170.1 30S ribosomal protein S9 [Pseudomonadota bacterium]MDG4543165.1 30S ribosomal protein S9 [Rickettsiales bacterium]MDG4545363.1 30S ribosomal protein S9 [Rickettsiales bacterium]MDG4547812.1 30S ribosomal protein S9 [Rickettsiales bacterium]